MFHVKHLSSFSFRLVIAIYQMLAWEIGSPVSRETSLQKENIASLSLIQCKRGNAGFSRDTIAHQSPTIPIQQSKDAISWVSAILTGYDYPHPGNVTWPSYRSLIKKAA